MFSSKIGLNCHVLGHRLTTKYRQQYNNELFVMGSSVGLGWVQRANGDEALRTKRLSGEVNVQNQTHYSL